MNDGINDYVSHVCPMLTCNIQITVEVCYSITFVLTPLLLLKIFKG